MEICQGFNEHCVSNSIPDTDRVVNSLAPPEYEQDSEDTYNAAMSSYKQYVRTLDVSSPSRGVGNLHITSGGSQGQGQDQTQVRSQLSYHFKKRDLPTFTGLRRDWAEFKSLWDDTVVPHFASNRSALAAELKRQIKGEALKEIEHISAAKPGAYDAMWTALCDHYDNITLSVFSALEDLAKLKRVRDGDHSGLVNFVRQVTIVHDQLSLLNQTKRVSAKEVTRMLPLLPHHARELWADTFSSLTQEQQIEPFDNFMTFLKTRAKSAKLLADAHLSSELVLPSSVPQRHSDPQSRNQVRSHAAESRPLPSPNSHPGCVVHNDVTNHKSEDCYKFKSMTPKERATLCAERRRCKRCLRRGHGGPCDGYSSCSLCGKMNHHELLCFSSHDITEDTARRSVSTNPVTQVRKPYGNAHHAQSLFSGEDTTSRDDLTSAESGTQSAADSEATDSGNSSARCFSSSNEPSAIPAYHARGFYSIYDVKSGTQRAIVFCDAGSDVSFISQDAARRLNARKLEEGFLDMSTLHGTQTTPVTLCEVTLTTSEGRRVPVVCYTLPTLAGTVHRLDEDALSAIFPEFDPPTLQRPSGEIDILLGADYFGLHPKQELASDGKNLSVMRGALGICTQGSHPLLTESTHNAPRGGHFVKATCRSVRTDIANHFELSEPLLIQHETDHETQISVSDPCASYKVTLQETESVNTFIQGEQLGTETHPKCGACKCGKCPIPGHTYSFKEEQELQLIQSKLRYDALNEVWIAGYPWLVDPSTLPDNYAAAYSTLCSTERTLRSDPDWKATYHAQVLEHEARGVARKLTQEEIDSWTGPYYYLSHMALRQPKSDTTPVRIVFNSSQNYKGVSLNSCLAKGPDAYNNNLLGMLIRYREEPVVMIGDIRKMYNSVHLEPMEQHMHRFLWRNCEERKPDVWIITRVNLGDRPSGTIAITAKDNTAKMFAHSSPEAAQILIYCTYTDDVITSVDTFPHALFLSDKCESILDRGGFSIKYWTFGGQNVPAEYTSKSIKQILGLHYDAQRDSLLFPAKLNFTAKNRKVPSGPNLTVDQVPQDIPQVLSRRIVLRQVMSIYDPLGLLSPFTLQAKILLRQTWEIDVGWDDPLTETMCKEWSQFFEQMFCAEKIEFPRCLRPPNAKGDPQLVIMSDGSEQAYGCVAYVRWELHDGTFFCRLIMAKSRISPLNRINIPQMELNGAVLSKRLRMTILEECRYKFDTILHLIDSETVLCQLHKTSTRFKVFEGLRIGEIQAATHGDVSCWGWIPGRDNIADITTRPKLPEDLGPGSAWQDGPAFLQTPIEEWNVNFKPRINERSPLPGEKVSHPRNVFQVDTTPLAAPTESIFTSSYSRCSDVTIVIGALARILAMVRHKSLSGGRSSCVTPLLRRQALQILVHDAQKETWKSPRAVHQQFKIVCPTRVDDIWVTGGRVSLHSPLSPDSTPLRLLPPRHPLTKHLMIKAHVESGHGGRDATIARFRASYYTSHASRLAQSVCFRCQRCRLGKARRLEQMMGKLPPARLLPAPPFSSTMLDLFGPYLVRGEVQKRTSGKAWGIIFTDMASRAVHIEAACGYDTKSFLLALSRFASLRGWPQEIYSDPGTQLKGASEELKRAYAAIDRESLIGHGASHGVTWHFGPGDSPWHQGAAEALIKSVKRAFYTAYRKQRLSITELLTAFTEIANLLNERPIGIMPSPESEINILTPNLLLLGRSSSMNPGSYEAEPSLHSRVTMVQNTVDLFWRSWTQHYAPTLVQQSKWLLETRGVKIGDVVLVSDSNVLRGEYRLARVVATHPSKDGLVRRVTVAYKTYKAGEAVHQYRGAKDTTIERSIQNLSMLIPVEESELPTE